MAVNRHALALALAVTIVGPHLPACRSDASARLKLGVTTSTRDSGLVDRLKSVYEEQSGRRVDVVAAGTGQVLRLGEAGDVDVVLVHAREAEERFIAAGHGVRHEEVMFNSFVLLGPPDDPAGTRGREPAEAFSRLADVQARFVSRGDDSGTHARELYLWRRAGRQPVASQYVETGRGQAATLVIADQMQAYVLSDRATYLRFKRQIELVPLTEGHDELRNPYSVIVVGSQGSVVRSNLGHSFADFLVSPPAQRLIADYTIEGAQAFVPLRLVADRED